MLRESNGREFGEIAEDREEPRERRRPVDGRREPREPREPRERAPREQDGDMVPLFLSLGKLHGVRPGEIVGMLYNEAGLPQGAVGHIKLFNKHSCIDVRAEFADRLIQVAKRTKLRGRSFVLDYDRGPGNRTQGH
jgi:ATP-dependent RNA helicase DeaD